jgi:glycosyltransferase involved in cell wall biosynthesis
MRILLVSHRYPPAYKTGTEVYSAQLAAGMQARGHAVRVLCAEKDLARPDLSVHERSHAGVPVTELINNLFHDDLRATWQRPEVDALFGELLDRERPDVVHLMHLMYLSTGCVDQARRRGIPVVFTLHDFWLACPRFGQLRHPDGTLCDVIDFARCGGCLTSFKHAQSPLERVVGRSIAAVHSATGLDLSGAARGAARLLAGEAAQHPHHAPDPRAAEALTRTVALRNEHMRHELAPQVARFIAPSRFLGERMIAWGLPREQVSVVTTGIDDQNFAPRAQPAGVLAGGAPLRILFLGTLAEHKGAHVLLEAWARLSAEQRARGRLDLFGPPSPDRAYLARIERMAADSGASLHGPLAREQIAATLRSSDLLVVPSLWYENAPMVILEAIAVHTPLLVSGLGGMPEMVVPGVSGFHFRPGDAAELATRLGELLRDPAPLARLFPAHERQRTFAHTLDDIEAIYAEVRSGARA